jgi:hypothetical protein
MLSMTIVPSYRPEDEDLRHLTLAWYRRARQAQLSHGAAAARARRMERVLGVPAVILSTLVGSAAFATIGASPDDELKIAAGALSISAALLAAVQTLLRLGDQAREHTISSREFGMLRRDLGQLGAVASRPRQELERELARVQQLYDTLAKGSPDVPARVLKAAREQSRLYWPGEFTAWPENPDRQA